MLLSRSEYTNRPPPRPFDLFKERLVWDHHEPVTQCNHLVPLCTRSVVRTSTIEERVADFLDAVVEHDPLSKAGVERTDGFLTHDELLELLGTPTPKVDR